MSLSEGTQLGVYEITGQIGAGGMGEVYRATDTKLGREVAIKTLPVGLADDPDRLARFEREAKLLASLNHAHIASVHSLDEHDGTLYIAMELVEGQTLEETLKAGPLPVDDALQVALQIALALEAAHEKGVIHRDLKPANIMVNAEGQVKVLDFGLAKAFSNEPEEASPGQSPALSLAMTQQGIILGTAGYMSPEQASGQPTDHRADIWAFGVVLYEMLTGLPLFSGESVPHILADVLKSEPDWDRLPKNIHPRLQLLLERCLTKKPRNRYHSIADARVDIESALREPEGSSLMREPSIAVATRSHAPFIAVAVLITAALSGLIALALWPESDVSPVRRFSYEIPGDIQLRSFRRNVLAVASDGSAFALNTSEGLYLRELSQLDGRIIPGTSDGLSAPFFSADGTQIAFQFLADDGALERIAVGGGSSVTIAQGQQTDIRSARWDSSDTIVFANSFGVYRVPGDGGTPELLVEPLEAERFLGPQLLPGGDTLLVSVVDYEANALADWGDANIVSIALESGERTVLIEGGSDPHYLPTGHIVYMIDDSLFGVAFDVGAEQVSGGAVPLVQEISRSLSGATNLGVTRDGTLIYLSGAAESLNTLVWVDRGGREETIANVPTRNYQYAQISPDGTEIAVDSRDEQQDIWVFDLARENLQRLTLDPGINRIPIWSPDGRVIFTGIADDGSEEIYWQASDGSGSPEPLTQGSSVDLFTNTVSPDGSELLVMTTTHPRDIFRVELGGEPQAAEPFIATPADEYNANFSPNGDWIAYQSDESGQFEIYLRPYPDIDSARIQVSRGGGSHPLWSPDGSELFYLDLGGTWTGSGSLWAVSLDWSDGLEAGVPEQLIGGGVLAANQSWQVYDYSLETERFLMVKTASELADGSAGPRVIIVENWFEELKRLVPTN